MVVAAFSLGPVLAGCSDAYYDRRDSIGLSAGDAQAANLVAEMVDPWPPHSNNKDIAFNGERMQAAVECYRNGKVITPVGLATSSASGPTLSGAGVTACPEKVREWVTKSATNTTASAAGSTTTTETHTTPPTTPPPERPRLGPEY